MSSLCQSYGRREQANRQSLSRYRSRQALAISTSPAEAAIIGEAEGAVKAAIVAFFSTLLQRRIIARIDQMGEERRGWEEGADAQE
jgi:hypothetical protein